MRIHKRSAKGFTMIELIVVIAIIGVLTAIMVPMLAGTGNYQAANAKAKSFYYASQSAVIDYKSDNADSMTEGYLKINAGGTEMYATDAGTFLYMKAKAEAGKGFTEVTLSVSQDDSLAPEVRGSYICMDPSQNCSQTFTSGDLLDKLNGFSTDEDAGYYYALIDSQCKVKATYWSKEDIGVLSDDTTGAFAKTAISFTDDYRVDYSDVGTFPTELGGVGMKMFDI